MPKRLIFLHIGKCGGTTVEANLARRDSARWFDYNADTSALTDEEVVERSLNADIIHIHGTTKRYTSRFSNDQWKHLLSESIRLCIVREPIKKYISDYRFAIQIKSQRQLPFIPNFQFSNIKEASRNGRKIEIGSEIYGTGYFTQANENMLSLNDCIELSWELNSSPANKDPCPMINHANEIYRQTVANLNTSTFAAKLFSENYDGLLTFYLRRNAIYKEVGLELGTDFMCSPRSDFLDILLCTELLDESLAAVCALFGDFRKFMREELNTSNRSTSNLFMLYRGMMGKTGIVNKTRSDIEEPSISPKNRFRFFLMNRDSYLLWQSSSLYSMQLLNKVNS